MKIGFIGLGTMGSGMASNLLKAGHKLTVWNRSVEKCEPFARKGARVADTPADAVRDAELVMYSLSNDQAVEEVVFGEKGILSGIKAGQIAIDMSTVLPATSLREQEAYAKRGVDFLDAPVFGSKNESAKAKLWILAAGNKAIFEKVKTVLEHLGQTVHYFGKNGNAAAMKLVGNLIVALEMESARGRPGARAEGRPRSEYRDGSRKGRRLPLTAAREQWSEYFETRFLDQLRPQAHAQRRGPH